MSIQVIRAVALDDGSSTRTVYLVIAALASIGLVLVVLAVWLIRQTRPERELLAPLERMADRSWFKQDPAERRRLLDDVRPEGARPLRPSTAAPSVISAIDAEVDESEADEYEVEESGPTPTDTDGSDIHDLDDLDAGSDAARTSKTSLDGSSEDHHVEEKPDPIEPVDESDEADEDQEIALPDEPIEPMDIDTEV